MNILLANMPIEFNKQENLEPPLGVCYIAAMFTPADGANVAIRDYEVSHFSDAVLAEDIVKAGVDVLGISFRTASYRSAKEFARRARSLKPDIFIVAGGHHATAFPKETLLDIGCDAVVRGEGEYVFKEMVERLKGSCSLDGLAGITYRRGSSEVVENPDRPPIEDLNALPFPARELLDLKKYSVITMLTSRGCPFSCIYCDKAISTRNVKFRSADSIFKEIELLVNGLGKRRLYIVDDHFFLDRKRVESILDRMIADKVPATWVCQARVDGIREDILRKAKLAGCELIMFGVETGDEDELRYIRKGSTLEQARAAVSLTKAAGITARVNFMLGFPVSTKETIKNTIKFARGIDPDVVRLFVVSPLPNTELWDRIYGRGEIPAHIRWEEIDFYRPSFDIPGLSRDELSLYVSAGYWHVLKSGVARELTIMLIPNMLKLLYRIAKTGRVRGNISQAFPRTVNIIVDNMHQVKGRGIPEAMRFLKEALRLEKEICTR